MGLNLRDILGRKKHSSLKGSVPPENRLVFYHIPKAAGSAVRAALKDLYFNPSSPRRQFMSICNTHASFEVSRITGRALKEVREQQLLMALASSKNRLIAGHFSFSCLASEHYRDNSLFMSLLREPVARFLSQYFYNRYKESDYCSLGCSLDEYLESESALHSSRIYLRNFGVNKSGQIQDSNDQYDQALQNLRALDILGVVEDMASFSRVLSERVGRTVEFPTIRPNPRSDYADEVTPAQRFKIEIMCAEDTKLYNAVREELV
jgi:hypothetical protein